MTSNSKTGRRPGPTFFFVYARWVQNSHAIIQKIYLLVLPAGNLVEVTWLEKLLEPAPQGRGAPKAVRLDSIDSSIIIDTARHA